MPLSGRKAEVDHEWTSASHSGTGRARAAAGAGEGHHRVRRGHRRALIASSVVDSADDLQLAFDTSDLAANLALAYFESGVSATLKADGTPVTEADRAVEQLLRETLSAARPEDALL